MKKIKKAIIPAAGLGIRFLPATKAMPKEMLPILDKPTIQYVVEEAASKFPIYFQRIFSLSELNRNVSAKKKIITIIPIRICI
ncbi:sugar phosphate nucleotidyltransferase, partial [Staphylococcus aureus]|uniref:sugar phosphate nucleotidyltransferase n=1 Tax=Staphylococcus aureus TaxID=1280 RepID=UPI00351E0E5D